ncbi:MAG: hypothetical protein JW861_12085 [Bacteroidales bacterium]|nr:hypothetical protein [Bacteroidales bacterium]
MRGKKIIRFLAVIYGWMITFLFLLVFVPKIIEEIKEDGFNFLTESIRSFADWSNPMPFFITYMTGYAVLWWKPLWGSIIIIADSVLYVVIVGIDGPPFFAVPAFLVGLFYLWFWILYGPNGKDATPAA